MTVRILTGDMRERLRELPDASVDAVVTDPPYHLTSIVKRFGSPEAAPARRGKSGAYQRASRGFMGQTWDGGDVAFRAATWAQVLRVMKPGAHLVAFSGTRTYHRMVCAIEDAGFEIRDQIAWLYGSGFPKSHDVSKGIDRVGGLSPKEQSLLLWSKRKAAGMSRDALASAVGCTASSVRDWEKGRARTQGGATEWIVPSDGYRARIAELLGYSADERRRIGATVDRRGDGSVIGLGHSGVIFDDAATPAAKQWQGWGTALKPALEPIVLARKPLVGSVAANVLAHGTGAINVDGCRVEGEDRPLIDATAKISPSQFGAMGGSKAIGTTALGRWPANVVHDGSDEVVAAFPETQSGAVRAGTFDQGKSVGILGAMAGRPMPERQSDFGSAARFFYSAKADQAERHAGCHDLDKGNKHPTVKPVDLMRWLVRMVTPPGGTVLDPFMGSGSTLIAADAEQFHAIGVEMNPDYIEIARRRLGHAAGLFAEVVVA